ncbi:hypothetical protein [Butyrivibrio sp. WCD3002]|uniref:hypothetical protein n=1 Tax=Butyrivibrio sp. WCD3002 TaxID=1280676 RepID=UPI000423BBCD|nr:hypothetical protein [Butyrivibrio sp. WCD3002]
MNTNNISEQKGTKISEKQCVAGYDKEAFSRFVKSKRKEIINADGKKGITTRELADMINIDYEQFRKIVNQNKPTKKRDCMNYWLFFLIELKKRILKACPYKWTGILLS